MSKSFAELQDGWMFCYYPGLLYKWERLRVLVDPYNPAEVEKLTRITAKLREELDKHMSREKKAIGDIIEQTNGDRYAGPMLLGRFQVMESYIKGTYYLADHQREDLIYRAAGPASPTRYFTSIEIAENFVKEMFTSSEGSATNQSSQMGMVPEATEQGNTTMAKAVSVKARVGAVKAAKVADAKIDSKPTKAVAAKPAPVAKVAKPAKVATPAAAPTERKGRSISTEGTVASMTRDLIMAGKLTDVVIIEKAKAAFPAAKIASNLVTHYRATLVKAGMNPPGPKA